MNANEKTATMKIITMGQVGKGLDEVVHGQEDMAAARLTWSARGGRPDRTDESCPGHRTGAPLSQRPGHPHCPTVDQVPVPALREVIQR